jgi:hypothetical protein
MNFLAGADVRYLFVGRKKETGEPVDGHIDAPAEAGAVATLAEQGIVATKIKPDPAQSRQIEPMPANNRNTNQQFLPALSTKRDEDKTVVIDRDKIRRNVAAAIDHALALSFARGEGAMQIRARVANAIHGLFKDYRNITSEPPVDRSGEMQDQIGKLQEVILRTEQMLTNWSKFGPPRGGGGGGGSTKRSKKLPDREAPDDVLREIFQANLQLMKSIEQGLTGGKPN